MLKNLFLTFAAVGILAGVSVTATFASGAANPNEPKTKIATSPTTRSSPISGKQMYAGYCASCHGVNGRGDGPAAVALKSRPTDLTLLSKNNGGKFPSLHVTAVLQHGVTISAHGSSDMPVWGPLLGKMDKASPQTSQLRISNLSSYLETIQAK